MGRYFAGLDLGQLQDFTALVIAEQTDDQPRTYKIGYLERFPLGTHYNIVGDHLAKLMQMAPFKDNTTIIADATGCGLPVVQELQRRRPGRDLRGQLLRPIRPEDILAPIIPVLITAGDAVSFDQESGTWHTAKRELASRLQVLIQNRRVTVSAELPEAKTLTNELLAFRPKVTPAGNVVFDTWRESIHDDTVLAAALALWYGEKFGGPPRRFSVPFVWAPSGV